MVMEAGRDTESLYTSDTVNVIEAMGRNAGWIAAGTALARRDEEDAPHIILLPERPFTKEEFKDRVRYYLDRIKRCVVVVSEGVKSPDGRYLAEQGGKFGTDDFGHRQLGGAAEYIKSIIEQEVQVKSRFAIPSTIQRTGAHFASRTDSEEAYLVGQRAVQLALEGVNGKMVSLQRTENGPYRCQTGTVDLAMVANGEKYFPDEWISPEGYFVTDEFLRYARPLIQGEVKPRIQDGLPNYVRLKKHFITAN